MKGRKMKESAMRRLERSAANDPVRSAAWAILRLNSDDVFTLADIVANGHTMVSVIAAVKLIRDAGYGLNRFGKGYRIED